MKSKTIDPLSKTYSGFQTSELLPFSRTLFGCLSDFEKNVFLSNLDGDFFDKTARKLKATPLAVSNAIWRIERKAGDLLE